MSGLSWPVAIVRREHAGDGALGDADTVLADRSEGVGTHLAEARRVVAREADVAAPGVLDLHLRQHGEAHLEGPLVVAADRLHFAIGAPEPRRVIETLADEDAPVCRVAHGDADVRVGGRQAPVVHAAERLVLGIAERPGQAAMGGEDQERALEDRELRRVAVDREHHGLGARHCRPGVVARTSRSAPPPPSPACARAASRSAGSVSARPLVSPAGFISRPPGV